MTDKRHHLRLLVRTLACTAPLPDRLTILNLSEGGMCIQAAAPLILNGSIHVRCGFAGLGSFIAARGEIAWVNSSGRAGIRFSTLSEISRARLVEWLFRSATSSDVRPSFSAISRDLVAFDRLQQEPAIQGPASRRDDALCLSAVIAASVDSPTGAVDLDGVLKLIAQRVQFLTRADGVAIALTNGDAMPCRARCGAAAPDLGARLTSGSGLCAEALRTGTLVQCDDAEMDSRAHWATWQKLGIRSAIVVPLTEQGTTLGVLAVFSERAYGFDSYDLATLERMAKVAAAMASPTGPQVAQAMAA